MEAVWPISVEPNLNGRFIRRSGWRSNIPAMRRQILLGALATVLCAILPLPAGGGDAVEIRAVAGGAMHVLMDVVARRFSGKVLGADRGRRCGRATYRLKVLTDRSDVLSVEADAATGEILSVRGHDQ